MLFCLRDAKESVDGIKRLEYARFRPNISLIISNIQLYYIQLYTFVSAKKVLQMFVSLNFKSALCLSLVWLFYLNE